MRVDGYSNVGAAPAADPNSEAAARLLAAQRADSQEHPAGESHDAATAGDSIEISQGARDLLGQAPVRPEMVDRARKILSSGVYNDKGVIEKTAEKIAASFSANA